MVSTIKSAGSAPTRNIQRHPLPAWMTLLLSKWSISSLKPPAARLPTVESIWSIPKAPARAVPGSVSAISATANPKTPPTPNPVKNR